MQQKIAVNIWSISRLQVESVLLHPHHYKCHLRLERIRTFYALQYLVLHPEVCNFIEFVACHPSIICCCICSGKAYWPHGTSLNSPRWTVWKWTAPAWWVRRSFAIWETSLAQNSGPCQLRRGPSNQNSSHLHPQPRHMHSVAKEQGLLSVLWKLSHRSQQQQQKNIATSFCTTWNERRCQKMRPLPSNHRKWPSITFAPSKSRKIFHPYKCAVTVSHRAAEQISWVDTMHQYNLNVCTMTCINTMFSTAQ